MDFLVGCTGYVGSNLKQQHNFNGLFHSRNVQEAYGKNPELLVYSGVPAKMFIANSDPAADRAFILNAIENIQKIAPKKLVLISTVSVYDEHKGKDENWQISAKNLLPYGKNRLELEAWVEENVSDYLIVRLPAIYGDFIQKNFLYDLIHYTPGMLTKEKMQELTEKAPWLMECYEPGAKGMFQKKKLELSHEKKLRNFFRENDFNALAFTDSRSRYQFYPLAELWQDIEKALKAGLSKINLVTEPVSVAEAYHFITGEEFLNERQGQPFDYDLRTAYADSIGGRDGYIKDANQVLIGVKEFVKEQSRIYE